MSGHPTKITHLVDMGDSLSDRGSLNKRELFGFIPMSYLSGLRGKSPRGRFTNGFLWGDFVAATTVEEFKLEQIRKKLNLNNDPVCNADVVDDILTHTDELKDNEKSFSLNDDKHISFKGERFARFYCEGGLTAHDYSSDFTTHPVLEVTRRILATLGSKREQLLADDKKYNISNLEKAETLVVEWSGANDLITANERPSHDAADKAVRERINNIEQLINNGYRNFVLFNLPDLSLIPRYQRQSKDEQINASECTDYFNRQLQEKSLELIKKYQDSVPINLSVFDVHTEFNKIYNNPEEYKFHRDKLKSPFVESEPFKENQHNSVDQKEHISPAEGYMFWDDVHPTADVHDRLAVIFKEKYYGKVFKFEPPGVETDVSLILHRIQLRAYLMSRSTDTKRKEKGELLNHFIFEIQSKQGNLEGIDRFISEFTIDPNYSKILTHQNPITDFFRNKTTTQSEDDIAALQNAIRAHLAPISENNEAHISKQ